MLDDIPERPELLSLTLAEQHDTTQQLLFVSADKTYTLPTQKNIRGYIDAYNHANEALYAIVLHYLGDPTIALLYRAQIVAVLLRNDEQNRVAFYNGLYPDEFETSYDIQDIEAIAKLIVEEFETLQTVLDYSLEEAANTIASVILSQYDEFAKIDLNTFISQVLNSKKAFALRLASAVGRKGLELTATAAVAGLGAYAGARLAQK